MPALQGERIGLFARYARASMGLDKAGRSMRVQHRACRRRAAGSALCGGLLLAALLVVTPAAVGAAESLITVEGNRRVEADTIRSYFRTGLGGHFDAAAVDAALKALYASGLFADVRINHTGDRLVV